MKTNSNSMPSTINAMFGGGEMLSMTQRTSQSSTEVEALCFGFSAKGTGQFNCIDRQMDRAMNLHPSARTPKMD